MGESQLSVTAIIWNTSSTVQEFDRSDTHSHTIQKLNISETQTFICQNTNTFKITSFTSKKSLHSIDQTHTALLKIKNQNKNYITVESPGLPSFDLYQIIDQKLQERQIQVKVGNLLKFGTKKIQVLYVGQYHRDFQVSECETNRLISYGLKDKNCFSNTMMSSSLENPQIQSFPRCRFCFGRNINKSNLIQSCCGCQGFLHMQCLAIYIKAKTNNSVKFEGITYVISKQILECQICKKFFNFKIAVQVLLNKKLQQLILFLDVKENLIYAVECYKKQKILIGRDQRADLKLLQNTVSRKHAEIFYDQNKKKFFIQDLQSKFGTFKKIQHFKICKKAWIQVGRNIFGFQRIKKKGLLEMFFKFCSTDKYQENQKKKGRPQWIKKIQSVYKS